MPESQGKYYRRELNMSKGMDATITLKEYLNKKKTFVIPDYQRGYVWGKKRKGEDTDAVTYMLENLLNKFKTQTDIFLQGVTVIEKETEIVLVDGQQRTTFLYILLKYLGYKGPFSIHYAIRKESDDYLKDILNQPHESECLFQDIYFFRKTLDSIKSLFQSFSEDDKRIFLEYVLGKTKFLYIAIPEDKATTVFSMMNGAKAEMRPEEIIKAEILRLASSGNTLSQNDPEYFATEWDENLLRSRYAREWDRWLHWWKQDSVKKLYRCGDNPLELLLLVCQQGNKDDILTFESFKKKCLPLESIKEAKMVFDKLRRLQKSFEDVYNNAVLHNRIGAVLAISNLEERIDFIKTYFANRELSNEELEKYYLCRFMGLTHLETMNLLSLEEDSTQNKDKFLNIFRDKYDKFFHDIADDYLYKENSELAFRTLLRLNIDQDILQDRKFEFNIWFDRNRSLEHIFPKSKVWHWDDMHKHILDGMDSQIEESEETLQNDKSYLFREDIKNDSIHTTEHSIGNLVLLYKDENSRFNNSNFFRKKMLFFNPNEKDWMRSRHLLHTICVFAEKEQWGGKEIADNKVVVLAKLSADYKSLKKEYYGEQD